MVLVLIEGSPFSCRLKGVWVSALLEVELDVTDRDGDADLDVLFVRARDRAANEVADGPRRLAAGAGVADAHPATELRAEPGLLGLLEKRPATVRNPLAAVG